MQSLHDCIKQRFFKKQLIFFLIDFSYRRLQISVVSQLIRTIRVFVFFLIDILRLLAGEILGRFETFVNSNFPFHLKLCKSVHSLLDLTCITEIWSLLDSLLNFRGVLVDQNSESFLGFLGLTIWSLSLGIDDDFLCCHSLSRLLHKLLLEAAHLVVELHVLIASHKHLLSHNLLLLVGETLTGSLCIEELILEPRLSSKRRLKHRWIN